MHKITVGGREWEWEQNGGNERGMKLKKSFRRSPAIAGSESNAEMGEGHLKAERHLIEYLTLKMAGMREAIKFISYTVTSGINVYANIIPRDV